MKRTITQVSEQKRPTPTLRKKGGGGDDDNFKPSKDLYKRRKKIVMRTAS